MKNLYVSRVCPACGSQEFRKVRSRRWIAFTDDRICTNCKIRYAPPTPRWAGLVFVGIGLFIGLFGGALLIAQVLTVERGVDPLGTVFAIGLLGVGGAALVQGVRALFQQGSV